jgi:hypothetical protein
MTKYYVLFNKKERSCIKDMDGIVIYFPCCELAELQKCELGETFGGEYTRTNIEVKEVKSLCQKIK